FVMRLQKVSHLLSTKHWSTHGLFLARFVEFRLNLPGTTSATLPSNCHPPAAARPWPATAESPAPPARPESLASAVPPESYCSAGSLRSSGMAAPPAPPGADTEIDEEIDHPLCAPARHGQEFT